MNNETKETLEILESKVASVRAAIEKGNGSRAEIFLRSTIRAASELLEDAKEMEGKPS